MRLTWYVLLVRQGYEQTVKNQINQKKTELNIKEVITSNELTGYILIHSYEITKSQSDCLLVFDGVLKFIGTKKYGPKKFSTVQIKKLSLENTDLNKEKSVFKKGDFIIIEKGDFSDISGEIVDIRKKIVRIKPEFLDRIIQVNIKDIRYL